MTDETLAAPAAAPVAALAAAPTRLSLFGIDVKHVLGGTAIAGSAYGLSELAGLYQPIIHWAVTGGAPTSDCEHALSVLGALVTLGIGGLVATLTTRGRAAPAAPQTGDTTHVS